MTVYSARKSKKKLKSVRVRKRNSTTKLGKKFIRVAAFVLVVGISVLFLLLAGVYKDLTKSVTIADSAQSYSIQGKGIYSLMFASVKSLDEKPAIVKELKFVIFDSNNKKVVIYNVPADQVIDVPGKFGDEKVSKILALGSLSNDENMLGGLVLLRKSIENLFGLVADRFIIADDSLYDPVNEMISYGNVNPLSGIQYLKDIKYHEKTDLTLNEQFDMYKLVSSLPSDRFIRREITPEYIANKDLLDEDIRDITLDSVIAKEMLNVSVLNGTDTPGLANLGSRFVQNIGGRVVSVGNSQGKYQKSILVSDNLSSDTVKAIRRFFDISEVIYKSDAQNIQENELYRSDVLLIIGFDTAGNL